MCFCLARVIVIGTRATCKSFRFFQSRHLFKHVDISKKFLQNFQELSESKVYEFGNNAYEK